jgi:hypothetical protein
MKAWWQIWVKAINDKKETEFNSVNYIRTLIIVTTIITNIVIVAGVIRHW